MTPGGVSDWPEATEQGHAGSWADAKSRVYSTRWWFPCFRAHEIHTLNVNSNVGIRRWGLWVGIKT